MSELVYIPDYADQAVALLLSQFQRAPRIVGLVRALAGPAQMLEDIGFDVMLTDSVDVAPGVVLDRWGRLVGEPRRGASDDVYRPFVQARITANNALGSPDDFIDLWQTVTGAEQVRFIALDPAAFMLRVLPDSPLSDELRERIRNFINSIRPAGIGLVMIEALPGALTYDNGPGYDAGAYARIL